MRHQRHGTTTAERVKKLRERLGLQVRVFGALDAAPKGPNAPRLPVPTPPAPTVVVSAMPNRARGRRPREGAWTCLGARVAVPRAIRWH